MSSGLVLSVDKWRVSRNEFKSVEGFPQSSLRFVEACRDICPAAHAAGVLQRYFKLGSTMFLDAQIAA